MASATVSAIIPTYNRANYIAQAVSSCLTQTYPCHQIIVIDDGSTDDTMQVLEQFGTRVTIQQQSQQGPAAARNAGLRMAQGDYVAFLDADDWWAPRKLEQQLAALQAAPDAALSYTDASLVDDAGRLLARSILHEPGTSGDLFRRLLLGMWMATDTILGPTEAFRELGGFSEDLRMSEDWDMWLRLSRRHRWVYVDEPLTAVRRHAGNMTRDVDVMQHTMFSVLHRAFADPALSSELRACWPDAFSTLAIATAMSYLRNRRPATCLRYLTLAIVMAPSRPLREFRKTARFPVDVLRTLLRGI